MPTPVVDPTFKAGCYVFGFSLPGLSYFGNTKTYAQRAIFGEGLFGAEIPGKNTEDDVFTFRFGSPNPKTPYYKHGAFHLSASPWPVTPFLCVRQRGAWAKRIIFYSKGGRPLTMRYSPYHASAKEHLVPWQLKLMESSFLYSILTDEAKAQLKADAARTRQATQGHNYFTKLYIANDSRWQDYV